MLVGDDDAGGARTWDREGAPCQQKRAGKEERIGAAAGRSPADQDRRREAQEEARGGREEEVRGGRED